MKQLSFLAIALCLLSGAAGAATLSGTVTNASTSAPVASQKIYIQDSLIKYYDSALTNSSGAYSFTLPSGLPSGDLLLVYTTACGAFKSNTHVYSGSSITSNFSVCASSATYTIHGTVSLGGKSNTGLARVYLIHKQYDSSAMDTTLTAIDSFTTASSGGTYTKTYSTMPAMSYGWLLVKAALLSSHPDYSSYLPTYYTSSLNWSGATALTASNFNPATSTNINMVAGTNPGGPGFIGGSVLLGANKSAGVGDPLINRILLLTKSTGEAVAYTYSDASGRFSFPNLAYGTYKIFGDAWGKTNPPLTVTISAAQPNVNNILFEENNKTFKGSIGLGVGGSAVLAAVSVYPNPVTDHVQFNGLSNISGSKTVVLSDVTGSVISRQVIAQGGAANVSTAALPAGVYMLQLQTEEGTASFRIVK